MLVAHTSLDRWTQSLKIQRMLEVENQGKNVFFV